MKPDKKLDKELKALNARIKKAGTVAEVMEAIAGEIGKPKEPPAPKKRKPKKRRKAHR